MAVYRQAVLFIATFNYIGINIVKSTSISCNNNELLQAETGSCVACTVCDRKLELVTWIPCTNDSDTICGPQLDLKDPTKTKQQSQSKHNIVFDKDKRPTEVNKWKTVEYILTGILIGIGLTSALVIITVCLLRRRRQKDSQWKKLKLCPYQIVHREDIRSINEIGKHGPL